MEFVEVIRNRERMCGTIKICSDCPLSVDKNGTDLGCVKLTKELPEKAEEIIMKWAEEHPIKTNKDKFNEIFPDFPGDIAKVIESCKYSCPNHPNCYYCNRKESIEFWDKEYNEVSKDADNS